MSAPADRASICGLRKEQLFDMEIMINKRYLKVPVSYSGKMIHFTFSEDRKVLYFFDAAYAEGPYDTVYYADLRMLLGKKIQITAESENGDEVVPALEFCDGPDEPLQDPLRPMVHFTAPRGWINDPNGLCFYKGTYHLFYQHNPFGRVWGNMHWGHAVSPDLIHWENCEEALLSDGDGVIYSGAALVDYDNVSGLKEGTEAPVLFYYTRVGEVPDQCLAVSNDGGKTLKKYEGNPVIPYISKENRDPRPVYDEERKRYLMALYMEESAYALFESQNLLKWEMLQSFELPEDNECPDLYPLQAKDGNVYWIFSGAHDRYEVGIFNEEGLYCPVQETGRLSYDSQSYAAQTFFYEKDKPVIRFGWDRSEIPGRPYAGSMCYPAQMGLKRIEGKYYLSACPLHCCDDIVEKRHEWEESASITLPLSQKAYYMEIHAGDTSYEMKFFGLTVRADKTGVFCKDVFLPRIGAENTLQIISDTFSTELYLNGVSLSVVAHTADYTDNGLSVRAEHELQKICVKELKTVS